MTQYVLGFLFNPEGTAVALIQKQRPSWMAGLWNGIGGHVEEGETPVDAMRREFFEETGVTYADWTHFVTLRGQVRDKRFEVVCFVGYSLSAYEVQTLTDELVAMQDRNHILGLQTVSNLPWLLEMARETHALDWPYAVEEKASHCHKSTTAGQAKNWLRESLEQDAKDVESFPQWLVKLLEAEELAMSNSQRRPLFQVEP